VNLRLAVLPPRGDGYHPVETVLQTLELADDLELTATSHDRVTLEITGVEAGALGPDADNLAVRAAEALRRAAAAAGQPARGVAIRLHKRIPHGAGLGGGSSDGAAVLRGMNELLERPLPTSDLITLGAALGSDVPFFVRNCSRALAWGRGEKTLPLPSLPARPVLVVVPPEPIATGWAYTQLDTYRASGGAAGARSTVDEAAAPTGWQAVAVRERNDFEGALFPLRPDLHRIKTMLREAGARPALLSGSGSALFGMFEDDRAAEQAEEAILAVGRAQGLRTFRTRTRA
jgi:4-diphosphocytidyl-2-C-methyl-D-erythritol kinase